MIFRGFNYLCYSLVEAGASEFIDFLHLNIYHEFREVHKANECKTIYERKEKKRFEIIRECANQKREQKHTDKDHS